MVERAFLSALVLLCAASATAQPNDGTQSERPSIHIGDAVRLEPRAVFRIDARHSGLPGEDEARAIDEARKRIGLDGYFGQSFAVQVDAELDGDEPWRDVYVDYRRFDAVRVRAGQFKLPFSLDENTSSANLPFDARSRAADRLAPGRDPGVMLHGRFWHRIFHYEAGVFLHDGRNARLSVRRASTSGPTTAARIRLSPLAQSKSPFADVDVAMAFTASGIDEGISGLHGRTAFGASFVPAAFFVNGARHRLGLETRWRPGPFTVAAEYIRARDDRRGQGLRSEDLSPLLASGWYVSGAWIGRGPTVLQRRTRAIELAARIEGLRFGSSREETVATLSPRGDPILISSDRIVTFSINWHLNRWLKVRSTLLRESLAGGLMPGEAAWSRAVGFQFAL